LTILAAMPVHQFTSSPVHQFTSSPVHQFTSSPFLIPDQASGKNVILMWLLRSISREESVW